MALLNNDNTSKSDAIKKFIDVYNELNNLVNGYSELLKKDIEKIDTSVDTLKSKDLQAGQSITLLHSANSIFPEMKLYSNGNSKSNEH